MIRCFIALELDDAARNDLRDVAATLDMTGWRETAAAKYHVTLKFLGDVDSNEIPNISQAIREACRHSAGFSLIGDRVALIPGTRRPRVLAAMFEPSDAIRELVEHLEILLADQGFAMEQRRYRPHVTLARKSRTGPRPHLPADDISIDHITLNADHVTLIQSILTNDGPIYQVMERFTLPTA